MLTMRPAPRWPILGRGLFSMIRTGTPFLSKVRASISPEGPAPTYAVKHRKLLAIDQGKSRTIRTWGVAREGSGMMGRYLGLIKRCFQVWGCRTLLLY